MLKLTPDPTFQVNVPISVPGRAEMGSITIEAKHLGRKALRAWTESAEKHQGNDAQWLAEVIVDWSGPQEHNGAAVPYSVEALANLLDAYPGSCMEIHTAYMREHLKAQLGNSAGR